MSYTSIIYRTIAAYYHEFLLTLNIVIKNLSLALVNLDAILYPNCKTSLCCFLLLLEVARAASIFHIDEVIVFDDMGITRQANLKSC